MITNIVYETYKPEVYVSIRYDEFQVHLVAAGHCEHRILAVGSAVRVTVKYGHSFI